MSTLENGKGLSVNFKGAQATICFHHFIVETEESESFRKQMYQEKFSRRAGREIPLEQIEVTPKAGEKWSARTCFQVKPGQEELYIGLRRIHRETPEVLPEVIRELEVYRERSRLSRTRRGLIENALGGLRRIISPD
jgi:hypothetical protein